MTPERIQVFPLLAATAKSFDQTAGKKGIKLMSQVADECQDICINGDKALVEREFAIIISNAVEAAPQNSVIDVSVQRTGDRVSVSCKDRGEGIKEELLGQIFERFRFVDGKPVTGLGLPLAQRLSNLHGGSVEINSTNLGTETRVILPIAV